MLRDSMFSDSTQNLVDKNDSFGISFFKLCIN